MPGQPWLKYQTQIPPSQDVQDGPWTKYAQQAAPQGNDYTSRVSSGLSEIDKKQQAEADAYGRGEQGEGLTRAQIAMRELSKASVPIREGVKSALSFSPDLIGDENRAMLKPVKDAISGAYQWAKQPSEWAKEGFAKDHPVIADTIGAAKDAAGGVFDLTTAGAGAKSLGLDMEAGKALKAIGPDMRPIPKSDPVFNEATKGYHLVDKVGAQIQPSGVNKFVQEANKVGSQNSTVKDVAGADEITRLLDGSGDKIGINGLSDRPLSIQDAHALDKELTQVRNGMLSAERADDARRVGLIQQALRKHLMTPDPKDISGGAVGFLAWKEANRLYSKASAIKQVEDIVRPGLKMEVPSTSIKTQFKNLYEDDMRMRGFKGQEDLVDSAGKIGPMTGLTRALGSRLSTMVGTGVGGASGGLPGAVIGGVAAHVSGAVAREAATALHMRKVNKLLRELGENSKFAPELTPEQIGELPPDVAKAYFEAIKNARGSK